MGTQPQVVVVAEDEWIIRETAVEVLTQAGFAVVEAADGAGALAAITQRSSEVRALFTDVRMPGLIDGLELADAPALSCRTWRSWSPRAA